MINYRLDFMDSIKLFLSIESVFRLIQCGFTQPLKAAMFLCGWQPIWIIYIAKYIGDFMANYTSFGPTTAMTNVYWLTNEVVCSIPVHLDLTVSFGIAIFIVMCNAAR